MFPWQRDLLDWYRAHRRPLPWRNSRDPYGIWVSEIMLQQTQVATVIPYWERWMSRFSTVEALAAASEDEVLTLWQGLGYYRRCRLLQEGAQYVAANGLPQIARDWEAVPGVGPYTAGAIASIAFGEPAPLVDGNVERVFARFFGLAESGPTLNRRAWTLAAQYVDAESPSDWNQALMELGATVCTPRAPACLLCPLSTTCVALREGLVEELPKRVQKTPTVAVQHFRWIPVFEDLVGLRQVEHGSWWGGMWDFPLTETESPPESLVNSVLRNVGQFRHAVTHHRITVEVWEAKVAEPFVSLTWISRSDLENYALPTPARRALALLG